MIPIEVGLKVVTKKPLVESTDWTPGARLSRVWGEVGQVVARHDSHGLTFEVRHQDGTIGHYEERELLRFIPEAEMIENLEAFERMFPKLLNDPAGWSSLHINYEPPTVLRLYRSVEIGGVPFRGCLHLISRVPPGFKPKYHPHPWPSAVRVWGASGLAYEMEVGYGHWKGPPPPVASVVQFHEGTYAMTDPNGWHSVNISGGSRRESFSVMLMGPPFRHEPRRTDLEPLGARDFERVLLTARMSYLGE